MAIPEIMKFVEAKDLCTRLKSKIFLPKNEDENSYMYDEIKKFASTCKPKNHATSFMWLGATDAKVEGNWTDLYVRQKQIFYTFESINDILHINNESLYLVSIGILYDEIAPQSGNRFI